MLVAPTASAQNMREVPIGGRTAMMGGAGTAAGDDSAMPYLNPAGIAGLPASVFGLSASLYGYTWRSFDDAAFDANFPPEFGRATTEREAVRSRSLFELPTSVMYAQRWTDAEAALGQITSISLVVPRRSEISTSGSIRYSLDALGTPATQAESFAYRHSYADYYLGLSHALALDGLRFGAGVNLLHARESSFVSSSTDIEALGTVLSYSSFSDRQLTTFAIVPILGAQIRVLEELWAGFGFAAPSIHIWGKLEGYFEATSDGIDERTGGVATTNTQQTALGSATADRPWRANVGLAWDDRDRFSVALDVMVFGARADAFRTELTQALDFAGSGELPRRAVRKTEGERGLEAKVDVSLGLEARLSELFALRAGGFTDFANTQPLDPAKPDRQDVGRSRVDVYGGTLGLGILTADVDTTVGAVYRYGSGSWGHIGTTGLEAVDVTEHTLLLVISGAVTLDEASAEVSAAAPFEVPKPGATVGGEAGR